jgi:hypothetical protein
MRHLSRLLQTAAVAACLLIGSTAYAQLSQTNPDINSSLKTGDDSECAIAKNPLNKLELFAACNSSGPGLLAMRSNDGGLSWIYPDPVDKTLADGDPGQGAAACCDPTLAWDTFGNLYFTYLDAAVNNIVTILSTDGGASFSPLATFGPASVDQPTVVAANVPGGVAVWIVWSQSNQMRARGSAVTGPGVAGVTGFNPTQTIPGTVGCTFGDVAISPNGAVVQACQSPAGDEGPSTIFVNTDADGLGGGNFGAAVAATTTNVGGFDFIPPQNARSVDSEAGLAYDSKAGSPHLGRLYLVYTEETAPENNNTDIRLRFSDDDGGTWSGSTLVNDDGTTRSQFLPKIAINSDSGNIGICWHDSRNSPANTGVDMYCTISNRNFFPAFIGANLKISGGMSTSNGAGVEFGDYSGLAYFMGLLHPIWADTSNSTGNNPNGTGNFEAYTDRISGGTAAD